MSLAAWMMHATEEFSQSPPPNVTEERLFATLNYDMFTEFESDLARDSAEAKSPDQEAGGSLLALELIEPPRITQAVWDACVEAFGPVPRRDFLFARKAISSAIRPDRSVPLC